MGKGDKKSRKGKIFRGSYGVVRPRKNDAKIIIATKKKTAPEKKTVAKKKTTAKK